MRIAVLTVICFMLMVLFVSGLMAPPKGRP